MGAISLMLYDGANKKYKFPIGTVKFYKKATAVSMGCDSIFTSVSDIANNYQDGTYGANGAFSVDVKTQYASRNPPASLWCCYRNNPTSFYNWGGTTIAGVALQVLGTPGVVDLWTEKDMQGTKFHFNATNPNAASLTITKGNQTMTVAKGGNTWYTKPVTIVTFSNYSDLNIPGAGVNLGFATGNDSEVCAFSVGKLVTNGGYHVQTNPYEDAGFTQSGGGDPEKQNWDDDSDSVTTDAMPSIGAVNSGMISIFSPTAIQLQDLADLLFSYNFFDWLQKNLQNLEELIVSLGMVPFEVTTGGSPSVTFLGFDISSFTHPVYLRTCTEQYYEFDMGSIAFNGTDSRIHTSDSVFDYSPFSRLGIYLPFIGFQELDIDEVRRSTISLRYRIDVLSGTCIAIINVSDAQGSRDIYQFSGNCLTQLPLGSTDMSSIVQGSLNIATAALSAGATGAIASAGDSMLEGIPGDSMAATEKEYAHAQNSAKVSNAVGNLASATVNGIMGMKPNYKHSGSIGASGGMLAVKQPYIFLTTPREAVPEDYEKYCGLPCNITDNLGNFSGFTVVEDIRLNGLVATSTEVEEIYQLLKSGIIV